MKEFTVVIPLIPLHDRELKRIFKTLATEAHLVQEVIICRSESKMSNSQAIQSKFENWARKAGLKVPITCSLTADQAYDGTNRNRGWLIAESPFVAFIDADDDYRKDRLTLLLSTFKRTNCDAILHNYEEDAALWPAEKGLEFSTSSGPIQAYLLGTEDPGDLSVPISDGDGRVLQIHHAHASVRTEVAARAMYTGIFPGADTELCKKLILAGLNVQYMNEKLSNWNRKRSLRYRLRLFKKRLSKRRLSS